MRTAGLTLLELLVAIAILSTLLAVAAPNLSAQLPAVHLDHASRLVAAELELARVRSIARNTRVRFVVEPEGYEVLGESEGSFVPEGGRRSFPGGVAFDPARSTRVTDGRVSITFLPRGNTSDNATIALVTSRGARRVIVNSIGRVRVE